MQKNVAQPFLTITNGVMTGTTTLYSSISNILYTDNVGYEISWTGSAVGTFGVQVSNSYKPALAQSIGQGAPSNGNWIALPLTNPLTNLTALTIPTSVGSPIALNLTQLSWAWIQFVYINSSSTGVLNVMFTAKSLG